jgi:hypothetical protein
LEMVSAENKKQALLVLEKICPKVYLYLQQEK